MMRNWGTIRTFHIYSARPDLFPVTQNFLANNNEQYENAIVNELDDILEFDANHTEKISGNFVSNPDDDDFVFGEQDEDGREDHGGERDEDGDEADVHNIALACRLISDDECEVIFTKSDAERIVLSRGLYRNYFGR